MAVHLIDSCCSMWLLAAFYLASDESSLINFVKGSFWRDLPWMLFVYIILLKRTTIFLFFVALLLMSFYVDCHVLGSSRQTAGYIRRQNISVRLIFHLPLYVL